MIHTVKVFTIVNEADVFLEFCCFFNNPTDVGNLISGSPAFSKPSLNIWKFTVHILLKPGLETWQQWSVGGGQGPMISAEARFLVPPTTTHLLASLWAQGPVPWEGSPQLSVKPSPCPAISPRAPGVPGVLRGRAMSPICLCPPGAMVGRGQGWSGHSLQPPDANGKVPRGGRLAGCRARRKDLCFWGPNPPLSLLHVLSLNLFKCLTKIQIKNNNHSTV